MHDCNTSILIIVFNWPNLDKPGQGWASLGMSYVVDVDVVAVVMVTILILNMAIAAHQHIQCGACWLSLLNVRKRRI